MCKIFLFVIAFSVSAFSLTLNQVRKDLKENALSGDSIEMNIRTMVERAIGVQNVSIYIVRKGPTKIYTEIKMPFMSQRSVVKDSHIKIIDLKTNKFQILPYHGEALEALSYTNFNPLDSGEWEEPKLISENFYTIEGNKGTLYYDSKQKRIERLESNENNKFVQTTFEYDAMNHLKAMKMLVDVSGVQTTVTTEILKFRSPKNFPDRLFEF